ncbi:MSI [Acanthosepion pharaonis]|uniref:MSI n=1 Tax=Acanthosepion pharaonis TaxID=158019 RepID=A0A812BXB9_ACAPH|nr:MSI [Sepia pharaonis]
MNRQKDEKGKLFIGRLSWETQSDTLLNYFSRYGEVIDCVVMKNKVTGCSRGFGFVTYKDPECVHLILSGGPHIIDGRQVDPKACNPRTPYKVVETKPQSAPPENQNRKIFVGGLPFDVDEGILIDFFSRYGKVKEASIMYDLQKGRSRGFGFLTFNNEDSVDEVCKEHFVTINGKQVECKRAEPLSKSKIPQDNDGSSSNNNNYFMPNSPPPPPPMLHQLQHPPPSLDLKPAPPAPGIEMWRPPPEGSNSENRKDMTSENGYNSVSNGDSVRQPYTANGAIPSIYQPVSYPGIYSIAQQQQMRQQQQSAVPVQQPTTAGQTYPPPVYPNFSSPPPQQSAHDYMAPWNQPASLESPGQTAPSDRGQWTGVPPPNLLPTQLPPQQQQQQPPPPPPLQPNSSYSISNQMTSPSTLPTVYPGLSPLGQLKIPPNFVNTPQTPVQQPTPGMPYSNFGFGDNENANFPTGPATPSPAGNGHMMMFTHTDAANPGHTYNQRQPITQSYHPYRR